MSLRPTVESLLSVGVSSGMYLMAGEEAKRRHGQLMKDLSRIKTKLNIGEMDDGGLSTSVDFLAKCDACENLAMRKLVGSTAVAAIVGGMFFNSPAARIILVLSRSRLELASALAQPTPIVTAFSAAAASG